MNSAIVGPERVSHSSSPSRTLRRKGRRVRRNIRDFWHTHRESAFVLFSAVMLLVLINFVINVMSVVVPSLMAKR